MTVARWLRVVLPLFLAAAQPVTAQAAGACTAREANPEKQDVKCAVQAARNYRFRASFSGSHDDTLVTLSAAVDGAPMACDAGSSTRLFGEDGDVQLLCLFSTRLAGDVDIVLVHRHAQFVRVTLEEL